MAMGLPGSAYQMTGAYVVRHLNVGPELLNEYGRARNTIRRDHLLELQHNFGFRPFPDDASSKLTHRLLPHALRSPKPTPPDHNLLEPVKFPPILTLDTSKTPKAGDARILARANSGDLSLEFGDHVERDCPPTALTLN
jgi:Domain of unknown function (DUF4158)